MTNYDESLIGKNLKRIRESKKIPQHKLADATGIANTTISSYENGKKMPSLITIINFANALEVSVDDIVFGSEINRIKSVSESESAIIVRLIYELWQRGMIEKPWFLIDDYSNKKRRAQGVWQLNHAFEVDRLLEQLIDFKNNEKTYSNPQDQLKNILDSATNSIEKNKR